MPSGPQPKDPILYDKIKERVKQRIPKHSAYRSGIIVSEYKRAYAKTRSGSPYYGKKPSTSGLRRWFKEEWRNQRGGVGYTKRGDIYRPTKRITKETPVTHGELSRSEKIRASAEKMKTGRVKKFLSRSKSRLRSRSKSRSKSRLRLKSRSKLRLK